MDDHDRCPLCWRRGPCECWIAALTPEQRVELQMVNLAKHLAKLDRVAFERGAPERKRERTATRGEFGNRKAGRKTCPDSSVVSPWRRPWRRQVS